MTISDLLGTGPSVEVGRHDSILVIFIEAPCDLLDGRNIHDQIVHLEDSTAHLSRLHLYDPSHTNSIFRTLIV
jgi:hypothetical protein